MSAIQEMPKSCSVCLKSINSEDSGGKPHSTCGDSIHDRCMLVYQKCQMIPLLKGRCSLCKQRVQFMPAEAARLGIDEIRNRRILGEIKEGVFDSVHAELDAGRTLRNDLILEILRQTYTHDNFDVIFRLLDKGYTIPKSKRFLLEVSARSDRFDIVTKLLPNMCPLSTGELSALIWDAAKFNHFDVVAMLRGLGPIPQGVSDQIEKYARQYSHVMSADDLLAIPL